MIGLTVSAVISATDVSVQVETGSVKLKLLDDVTFISKEVTTSGPRTLVIHYFAECQVTRGHIEYDIVVNKGIVAANARQVPPTHDNTSVLCSNDGTSNSSLSAASVGTVVACAAPSAGNYTIKVRGHVKGDNAMLPALVDEQSLVIEQHVFSRDIPKCIGELPEDITSGTLSH